MNKKGFTLVELMAILIVLSAILMVGIPSVLKMINQAEQKKMDTFLESIYAASEIFVETNVSNFKFSDTETDFVLLEELVSNGYLDGNLINPKTDTKIKYESSVIEVSKDQAGLTKFVYVFQENNTVFTVKYIEDLVTLSKSVAAGNDQTGIRYHLLSSLDFNDNNSYHDYTTTSYGDINENGSIEDLKTELTTAKGFLPIGSISSLFKGSFYGRGNSINNLYINRPLDDNIGLFGVIDTAVINGLNVKEGSIIANQNASLIAGSAQNSSSITSSLATGTINVDKNRAGCIYAVRDETTSATNVSSCVITSNGGFEIVEGGGGEEPAPTTLDTSGANAPTLVTGGIPVYWDSVNRVWRKADASNNDINHQWYDYDNYMWANMVTTTSTNRANYLAAAPGQIITRAEINSWFVWIPRYEYRIQGAYGLGGVSATLPGEIEVNFISKTKTTPTSTYKIHPAFKFGTLEASGMWFGKFQTTGGPTAPTIMPSEIAFKNQTPKVMFDSVKNYMQSGANYGLTNDNDVHMAKNTEWGAPLYLSQSKYGKYGNPDFTGANIEIYMSNSSAFDSSRSSGAPSGSAPLTPSVDYNTNGYYTFDGLCTTIHTNLPPNCNAGTLGQVMTQPLYATGASTTGTIYGVFGMSGGTMEYMMAIYQNASESLTDKSGFSSKITNSQFEYLPDPKYYDVYTSNVYTSTCIDGDGICETVGWYSDNTGSLTNQWPWYVRGGSSSGTSSTGAYFAYNYDGGSYAQAGFRIAMIPNE